MVQEQNDTSCPTSKPEQCQEPFDKYMNCEVCKNCPRPEIQKIKELFNKIEVKQ
jgi:hypothetical protein